MSNQINISKVLVEWYLQNKRDLPWRQTHDPYKIWISEIILQQTRVDQGLNYYYRFIERYPDVESLAKADIDEVMRLWQGLGYYSRALNLHHAAKSILDKYDGVFPNKMTEILQLKGVGEYTAAAIASFAFDLPFAVLDGNVFRVISRIYGIENPINQNSTKKMIQDILCDLLPKKASATFNQAIMEFGALQCKPHSPDCSSCPIILRCKAFANNLVSVIPFKNSKLQVQDVYYDFLFLMNRDNKIVLIKRDKNGIWRNLYSLPFIENLNPNPISAIVYQAERHYKYKPNYIKSTETIIHKLSHRKISARFHVFIGADFVNSDKMLFSSQKEINDYGFPKLIVNQFDWLWAVCDSFIK